jgi:uncharacterized protein
MSLETARRAVDFIFQQAPQGCDLEIGFFGGEPLLEFELLQGITDLIEGHPCFDPEHVDLALTTNGTVFSDSIASFLAAHFFKTCVSCDGPPDVHNRFRSTAAGEETASIVERTLRAARDSLPAVFVNAVYHPGNFRHLPRTLKYLSGLGLRQIFLNPDFSAQWTLRDAAELPAVYRSLADLYIEWYLNGAPHFVSVIDAKIAVLLRGGYQEMERCQMGTGELAIAPDGSLYPCERLIGSGTDGRHRIGAIDSGVEQSCLFGLRTSGGPRNPECRGCSVKAYCMNWCGCSNVFMTGLYDRVGPFLCASERALIEVSLEVLDTLERKCGPVFIHHFSGMLKTNSWIGMKGGLSMKYSRSPP